MDLISILSTKKIQMPLLVAGLEPSGTGPLLEVQQQCHSLWCWAAVVAAVAGYSPTVRAKAGQIATEYGRMPPAQCDVAFVELKKFISGVTRDSCCGLPCHSDGTSPINAMSDLGTALNKIGALASKPVPSYIEIQKIIEEFDADRPVCARVKLSNTGQGHFMALVGYQKGPASTFILGSDPISGPLRLAINGPTLADLKYPNGVFTNAYFTR